MAQDWAPSTTASRRTVLELLGAAVATTGSVGAAAARDQSASGTLEKVGHSLLSNVEGGYTEAAIRDDGRFGLTGSFLGSGGSYLVDLEDPSDPTEVHRLPSSPLVRNADVKFDSRDGLYYRSEEPNRGDVTVDGVAVIDYGFAEGSPEEPVFLSQLNAGPTHNLFPHPNAPVVYTVNAHHGEFGLDVFDVSDPANPEKVRVAGPPGELHDVVVDPENEHMHAAYIGGETRGYVILDVSDPLKPAEIGRFSYERKPTYSDAGIVGFENCHFADYDPERGIGIVGDEMAYGIPGGKHFFDIGWKDGSPSDPRHVGFTRSPNAEMMNPDPDEDGEVEGWESYDWTTHNHDVVPRGDRSLLVSGDYLEGMVLYDVTDPTNPTPVDRYATDDMADQAEGPIFGVGGAPFCWGGNYNRERDLVFASDMVTGVYTFRVNA
ncbi:LVIVD repeat-containing protein [Halorussus sp. MSC15.2]|uniref:LVIVD repeat-containing protein n=1 Tax=Halorussus sp. MSC15.2 TaxID=2283638 RepID=UPI0013D2D490|nr:hypothetical protein [Halorussus sp. MSC15.2]NEU55331.1 hypothetical protein [Halorussus sp. MSC15.2]